MDPEHAQSAIDGFRSATTCTPELRAANLRAIEARLRERAPARAPSTTRRTTVIVAVLAAAAITAWIARDLSRDAIAVQGGDAREQARDEALGRAREPATLAHPPIAPALAPAPTPEPPTPESPAPPRTRPRSPAPPVAAAPADLLAREAALVAAARTALTDGDLPAAAAALATLDRELPGGELDEERRMLARRLQCARGDATACVAKSP